MQAGNVCRRLRCLWLRGGTAIFGAVKSSDCSCFVAQPASFALMAAGSHAASAGRRKHNSEGQLIILMLPAVGASEVLLKVSENCPCSSKDGAGRSHDITLIILTWAS